VTFVKFEKKLLFSEIKISSKCESNINYCKQDFAQLVLEE